MAVLQDININVHGQPSEKRLQTFLRLSQNENGRMINFRVLGPPLPSGCTATFSGTKPDGNVYSKTGTVAGNFVIIQEDMQMTVVAGVWDAKLDIINGSHNIMTALIRVVVDADVVDPDAIASDSQLQGLVAEAKYYAEHARTDAYGSPLTATAAAEMTDKTRVYVYTGSETGMTAGNWYYWNGSAWTSGGVYNAVAVQTDTTLSVAGKAADAKKTGDEIASLKEDLTMTEDEIIETAGVIEELECGLTEEVKTALLACFEQVAWIGDDGQTYYDALSNALNRSRVLSSIRAVFTQGSAVIYDTDELYALKQYLTVTATYDDGTTKEVNNYTLNGELVAGTSTITVAYNKKTTTFNVTVTHQEKTLESISASFSSSASITTDNVLDDLRPYLTVRAVYSDGSIQTVTNYTLRGSLNVGTNTITVTYSEKKATFTVNVTQAEKTLQSISAVFNQGSAVIYTDSSLNVLKPYLTVTARYSDGTTQTVTDYTLSGTLTEGTSTITASYGGKTDTFNVSVTAAPVVSMIHNWDFTESLVDSVSGKTATTNATRNSNGVLFNADAQYIDFGLAFSRNRTYEIDVDSIGTKVGSTTYRRLFAFGENGTATASNTAALVFGRSASGYSGWWWYLGSSWDASPINAPNYSSFNNKTLKIYVDSTGKCLVYTKPIGADDSSYVSVGNSTNVTVNYSNAYVYIGGSAGDALANAVIKAFRVYEGVK